MRAGALVVVAALLPACAVPARVAIDERGTGYVAVAHANGAEKCARASERVEREAGYFCSVRKQSLTRGRLGTEDTGSGCRIELTFWCTTPVP